MVIQTRVCSTAQRFGWTLKPRWPGSLRTISKVRCRTVADRSTSRPAKPWSAVRPEEQVFTAMLTGFANQQLSRNLARTTVEGRENTGKTFTA